MPTKLEYLHECVRRVGPIENKDWFVMVFTTPILKETSNWESREPYDLVTQPDGVYFLTEEKTLAKLDDYKKDEPLFTFTDPITIDSSWLSSVTGKTETTVGRLLVNALALHPVVGSRLPFLNKRMSQSEIEAMLSAKTKNDEDFKEGDIRVREMIDCIDRLNFFMSISTFTNIGATKKTITSPPGIKEYKEQLVKEYGDRLNDPVTFVEFENKLAAKDAEYLAGDPAAKNIFNKKSRVGRAKMFLAYGNTLDFREGDKPNVVLDSLSDGISTDPEELAKHMNDLRYGSFSRGSSTALSGYSYKVLQRSLSGLAISTVPCDTTKGFKRLITEKNSTKLVGRYVKEKTWILIENPAQAKTYAGKVTEIRSSLYCTSKNNTVCYACMSESYKNSESGITNLAANISSVLMVQFLKLMHGVTTEVIEIDVADLCA